jgi:hypothetical protein
MKSIILAAIIATTASFTGLMSVAHAADPCEDKLAEMRAEMAISKVSADDMAKVKDLETKGVERCNADDDKRADGFFADAMKIMGK